MIINPQQLTLPSSTHNKNSNKNNNNKHTYDVVDHVHAMDESIPVRNVTPSFVIDDVNDDNEFSDGQQQQQQQHQESPLMYENNNFEFSDIDEPRMTRARTRSQSRAKENSIPPTDEPKPTALKRNKKTTKTERVRRRRPLKEEPISDDDIIE